MKNNIWDVSATEKTPLLPSPQLLEMGDGILNESNPVNDRILLMPDALLVSCFDLTRSRDSFQPTPQSRALMTT
jgi:hypothetical protein